jgi:hypothetical protein
VLVILFILPSCPWLSFSASTLETKRKGQRRRQDGRMDRIEAKIQGALLPVGKARKQAVRRGQLFAIV